MRHVVLTVAAAFILGGLGGCAIAPGKGSQMSRVCGLHGVCFDNEKKGSPASSSNIEQPAAAHTIRTGVPTGAMRPSSSY